MEGQQKRYHLLKYSSVFHRLTQAYFNDQLKDTGVGAGQQYFLDRIERCPGISITQLAQTAAYDNGTSAKAVKKLADDGFIRIETDENDGRCKRLYATEKALPVVERIREMKRAWRAAITAGFTDEEKEQASDLLRRLTENALAALNMSIDSEAGK